MSTAKIFTHGRSQAVLLPKTFKIDSAEVRISKVGDAIILEPIRERSTMPWAMLDQIGDTPFMPNGRELFAN